jgi:sugar phosphate isomerase/epimerase
MKLPNAHLAIVEREKITEYLLNPTHPDNGGKSGFFHTLGFERVDWAAFAAALRQLAITGEVTKSVESPHGNKYIVDGRIDAPNTGSPMVRSVWIVDRGLEAPRLVTAYPHEERG